MEHDSFEIQIEIFECIPCKLQIEKGILSQRGMHSRINTMRWSEFHSKYRLRYSNAFHEKCWLRNAFHLNAFSLVYSRKNALRWNAFLNQLFEWNAFEYLDVYFEWNALHLSRKRLNTFLCQSLSWLAKTAPKWICILKECILYSIECIPSKYSIPDNPHCIEPHSGGFDETYGSLNRNRALFICILNRWTELSRKRLDDAATHCNTLQHTATHCNTLQHITSLPKEAQCIPVSGHRLTGMHRPSFLSIIWHWTSFLSIVLHSASFLSTFLCQFVSWFQWNLFFDETNRNKFIFRRDVSKWIHFSMKHIDRNATEAQCISMKHFQHLYSQLQIGCHSISRLFLKLFQRTRILSMGFTISTK